MSLTKHIGCLHLGHNKISEKFRPEFKSDEFHDQYITEQILKNTKKRDTLWLHGDLFFTEESLKYARQIVNNVSQVNIIIGNHDTDRKVRMNNIITLVNEFSSVKIHSMHKRYGAWLTHAPIHPNELRNAPNIHAHTHRELTYEYGYFSVSAEAIGYIPRETEDILKAIRDKAPDRYFTVYSNPQMTYNNNVTEEKMEQLCNKISKQRSNHVKYNAR